MKNLKFKKEEDNKWYIDLPEWTGDKADLEMVAGADTLLDILSNNSNTATIEVSETPIENAIKLKKLHHIYGGAEYKIFDCPGVEKAWLCKVTKFVYGGYMPNYLFIKQ
jgi:hypothetical protein